MQIVNYFTNLQPYVTLNSRNTKLKNDGVHWGLLDIQNVLHVNFKTMYFFLYKVLEFWVKLLSCGLVHATSPDLSCTYSMNGTMM